MGFKETLKDNYAEYRPSAEESYSKKRYNVAAMIYYKCLTTLADYLIYEKTSRIVSNHTERFKILEKLDKGAYDLLSPLFDTYRQTYFGSLGIVDVTKLKDAVERLEKIVGIEQ
jgi:hypothetical protein